ncbi:hypothetical protein CONLIGDRAFT_662649 [Coniochaeta ligniaria NRRL 30616]|uniref:Uncharacterized protein n=1 Tax=Coniochaeta ligniaria NRRL 30616 TaxID=1408157 RepID=A0A1J7IJZ8_9PEZI|nr:hypothetical protein CONLIGDRAFT_662649 [Coniochaeta ligniaria NRRL 30616]
MTGSWLGSNASVQRGNEGDSAIRLLSEQPQPSSILITDDALTHAENAGVWEAVLQYVRHGGTSVIMGHFSSYVKPPAIKPFFAKAGLQWEVGSYHRTTLVLNQEVVANALGLFVKNAASADAWYLTDKSSVIGSQAFAATSARIVGETAVALARIEREKLGYVGVVTAEKGSDAVILAMCGL